MSTYTLPNGLAIQHANAHETAHLYTDIFQERLYVANGIGLPQDAIVFDVGANIGLFTLFVVQNYPSASVFAVEPAPRTFELLTANTSRYGRVSRYNCGAGASAGTLTFTYFPNLTCGSGYYDSAEIARIESVHRSMILADPKKREAFSGPVGEELLSYYLDRTLRRETVNTPVRPLSALIDESGVNRIDLLKIDAEGCESQVLAGIREDQWSSIRQLVVEVHDSKKSLAGITSVLSSRGYWVHAAPQKPPDFVGKAMVYAKFGESPSNERNVMDSDSSKYEM